jgi:hypothetical protein
LLKTIKKERGSAMDVIVSQSALPISRGVAIRPWRAEAPIGPISTFKDSEVLKSYANDNRLAWPYIPFPYNLLEG